MNKDLEKWVNQIDTEPFDELLTCLIEDESFAIEVFTPEELKDKTMEILRLLLNQWEIDTDWNIKYDRLNDYFINH